MSAPSLFPSPLVVATHNAGKLKEISALLAPLHIQVSSAAEAGVPEPEETGTSFAENALLKAHHAAQHTGKAALADDSGLMVDALGGEPGVYTANWAETPHGRDWMLAMQKVEDRLQALGEHTPRDASFVCTLAIAWPNGEARTFEGRMAGSLVWPPRGTLGFGYDPVFMPQGYSQTFAEMAAAEKQAISHRAKAFAALVAWLEHVRKAA